MITPVRSFIAIELPDEAAASINDLQNRLKAIVPPNTVRWTAPKHIHLTLHFLGNVDSAEVKTISEMLAVVAQSYSSFSLNLARLGCFPHINRPRVVWAGVSGDTDSLSGLYQKLGTALTPAFNFAVDKRPYTPHLTIGRINKGIPTRHLRQVSQILNREQLSVGHLAILPVRAISLIKSELTSTGAHYTTLRREHLK